MSISNHTNDNNDIINTTNKNDNNTMNNTSNSNNTNNSLWNDMVNEHTDINSDSPLYSSLLSLLSSPTKTLYIRNGVIHDPDGILALALMASPFVTAPISTLQFSMPRSLFGGDINPALILAAFNVSLVALIPNHYQESQQQQLNDDNNNNNHHDSSDNVKAVQIKYKNNISDAIVYDSNNNNTTTSNNNSTTRSTHNSNSNSNNNNNNTTTSSSLSSCEQFSLNYIPSQTPFTILPTSGLAVVRGVDIMNANVFITLPCLPIIDNNASNNTNNNDGNMNQNHTTTTNNNSTINNNNNLNNNDNEVDSIESMILMRAAFSIPSVLTYSPIFPKNAYSTADIINEGGTGSGVMKPRKNMKRMNK